MSALGDMIPDENVAVQAVSIAVGLRAGIGDPVIVIGSPHLVRISVIQWPADASDEDGRIFLKNDRLPPLARQVRIHRKQLLRVQKREFFWEIRVAWVAEFGEHLLRKLLGTDQDLPDLANN